MVANVDIRLSRRRRIAALRPLRQQVPLSSARLVKGLLWDDADSFVRRLLIISLLLMLVSSVAAGVGPLVLKLLIDGLERSSPLGGYNLPLYLVTAYVLAHWLGRALTELRGALHGRTHQRVQRQLSESLFHHIISLPLSFHLGRKTGGLSQTLTNGLLGCRMVLHHLMLTALPIVTELITMGTVLILLDHAVFLAIICISTFFYTLAFWAGIKRIGKPARAVSTAHIDANAILTDSIMNYETIKYCCGEPRVRSRFVGALTETEDQWTTLFSRKMANGLAVATIFALTLGASVYLAAQKVQQGSMSIGEFALVNAYVFQITRPVEMIGIALRDMCEGMVFVEKMVELFGEKREVDNPKSDAKLAVGAPELSFEKVSLLYNRDSSGLKNISFVVPATKTTAVVGATGSGKSSLVRLLLRLIEPSEGQICLNGVPLNSIPLSTLRNSIAVVPQDIVLFNESIGYNIGFGKAGSTREDIISAAKVAHIHDFIEGLPMGYDAEVGERGLKLSGGERQRIGIARAAIKRPDILVLDEATCSLDAETERAILTDLARIMNFSTNLVIAHRLSTVQHADEILVLSRGIIVERGTHNELLQQGGAYEELWHAQHEKVL